MRGLSLALQPHQPVLPKLARPAGLFHIGVRVLLSTALLLKTIVPSGGKLRKFDGVEQRTVHPQNFLFSQWHLMELELPVRLSINTTEYTEIT